MSIDRSLRSRDALVRHRNVLTRAERIEQMKDEERWEEGGSVLGLPKVAHRKSHAGRKAAKEKEAVEGAVVGVEDAAAAVGVAAGGGKAAAAGKAPAAKAAAPAAKAGAPAAQKPGKEAKKK